MKHLPLSTTRLATGRRTLNRDFVIDLERGEYMVPAGFPTDFSSYPWFSRLLVRFDRVDIAGVVHDRLYYEGKVTRAEADKIWRDVAMAGQHAANPVQAWLSWFGLRLGGWWPWHQHRKREQETY